MVLTVHQVLEKIRFDRESKRGSVLDVVQLVTKCSQDNASKVFQRLSEHHPDLRASRMDFKFPGQGQRPTPVANVVTLCEIAWLLPGLNAAIFRKEGAATLCRALGGDLTLIDEIKARHGEIAGGEEQGILLEGTGVTVAEANGTAIVIGARSNALLDLEIAERKLKLEERKLKLPYEIMDMSIDLSERLKRMANDEADERFRMALVDASKNVTLLNVQSANFIADDTDNISISISSVAAELGKRFTTRELSDVGRVVAAAYREKHGKNPPQHEGFANGHVVQINSYFKKDRELIVKAIQKIK